MTFTEFLETRNQTLSDLSDRATYEALLAYVKTLSEKKGKNTSKRKVYYISAEFLDRKSVV